MLLTVQQTESFKKRLMDMRDHLLDRIERFNDTGMGDSMSKSTGELSTYDNHPGDVGSEMFERGKDFALREDAITTIGAIDDALSKIDNGRYGRCEVCGRDIPVKRLAAVPYTTQCVDCKSRDEQLPKSHQRTAEEDVLDIPFARSWQDDDKEDFIGFDGEDSWESVAVWNEHADRSRAGSYYGDQEMREEEVLDNYDDPDNIPYFIDKEGVIYQDFRGFDDESSPYETIDLVDGESKSDQKDNF